MRGPAHPAGVGEQITREEIASEPGRSRVWPSADDAGGPHREDEESKPMTNEQEKSDLFIVAMKLANKPGRPGAESVEPRKRTEGNTGEPHTCRTQRRESVSQRLDWVRGAARGASSLITRGRSPVRELRPPGSVRGVLSNGHPYRDSPTLLNPSSNAQESDIYPGCSLSAA